jgi:hypothetical protein
MSSRRYNDVSIDSGCPSNKSNVTRHMAQTIISAWPIDESDVQLEHSMRQSSSCLAPFTLRCTQHSRTLVPIHDSISHSRPPATTKSRSIEK